MEVNFIKILLVFGKEHFTRKDRKKRKKNHELKFTQIYFFFTKKLD